MELIGTNMKNAMDIVIIPSRSDNRTRLGWRVVEEIGTIATYVNAKLTIAMGISSDTLGVEFKIHIIKKYKDIYSNINYRFNILDL